MGIPHSPLCARVGCLMGPGQGPNLGRKAQSWWPWGHRAGVFPTASLSLPPGLCPVAPRLPLLPHIQQLRVRQGSR